MISTIRQRGQLKNTDKKSEEKTERTQQTDIRKDRQRDRTNRQIGKTNIEKKTGQSNSQDRQIDRIG